MEDLYKYDREFSKQYVITGTCSLSRNGLIFASVTHLDLQTAFKKIDKFHTIISTFYYNPHIDYNYCVIKSHTNPLLLIPTKERALVECIKHLDWIDEGLLIEGIKSYINNFWDEKLLLQAADYFNLDRNELGYWLDEAKNDYDD